MSRRRYPGILGPMELWRPNSSPARSAPAAFVTIARTFEQIDLAMLDEIQADARRSSASRFQDPLLYDERYNDIQSYENVRSYIADIKKGTSHISSEADTCAYLTDTKCMTAWSWIYLAVWERQTATPNEGKARALEILTLAQAILDMYDGDESQNVPEPGPEDVSAGIEDKLRKLLLFDSIFSRLSIDETRWKREPVHHSFKWSFDAFLRARKDKAKADRKERYATTDQNRNILLVTATVVSIAISVFPLGLAFHTSTIAASGSASDADFWLLIQNSLMQVLGLATTTLISLVPKTRKQNILVWPNILIWAIAVLGLGSALSAPLLYVRVRTIYSALLSFLASAAQACMVLQLALLVDVDGKGAKLD